MVVEFDGTDLSMVLAAYPEGEAIAVRSHRVTHQWADARLARGARILAEGGGFPWALWIVEQRFEARAFEMGGQGEAREIGECRVDIHQFHEGIGPCAGVLHAWHREQERGVDVVLGVGMFTPRVVLAEFPTVVTP